MKTSYSVHIILLYSMDIILIILAIYIWLYIAGFFFFSERLKQEEKIVIAVFLQKVAKIPALIEVMRPYVAKKESFDHIIELHTEAMIQEFRSIYDILGLNGKVQNDFLFLMQLSVHIPKLQKDEYFVYIRDFIIDYERLMRSHFSGLNSAISMWNLFVKIKNMTFIWLLLPGEKKMTVR